jgi:hypothetical protein
MAACAMLSETERAQGRLPSRMALAGAAAGNPAASAAGVTPRLGQVRAWSDWSRSIASFLQQPAAQLPGGAGSDKACAAAKQKLLLLQRRLDKRLQAAAVLLAGTEAATAAGKSSSSSSNSSSGTTVGSSAQACTSVAASGSGGAEAERQLIVITSRATAMPGVLQAGRALALVLVTQCPLPYCCNNPGCVELRGARELQLVGGKGTVCSRCR